MVCSSEESANNVICSGINQKWVLKRNLLLGKLVQVGEQMGHRTESSVEFMDQDILALVRYRLWDKQSYIWKEELEKYGIYSYQIFLSYVVL